MPRAKHYNDAHLDMAIKLVEANGYSAAKAGRHVAKVAGLSKPIPGGSIRSALKRRRDEAPADASQPEQGEPVATPPVATPPTGRPPVATPQDTIPAPRHELTVPAEALSDPRVDATRLRAAIVLAQRGTHEAAAEAAGVARSTVTMWMRDPVMQTVVGDLRAQVNRALWERGAQALLRNAVEGIDALGDSSKFLRRVIARAADAVDDDPAPELDSKAQEVQAKVQDDSIRRGLEAARALPTTVRPMMDAGGFPKTERIEHAGGVEVSTTRTPEQIDAEIAALDAEIAALESGDVLDVEAEEAS